jgi:hypothetical protein
MAQYTGIQGQNILIVSSDPANPTEGQIWYNSTSNLLKGYQFAAVNAWASGGNMNTGRETMGDFGAQTSSIAAGGSPPTNASESYNGTSWTSTSPINTTRYDIAGAGVSNTSGIIFGGNAPPFSATESWNGTSWTSVNSLNTSRAEIAGIGTQTAAIAAGGNPGPGTATNITESWNGTSWTTLPATLPTSVRNAASSGIQTAGLIFGGVATAVTGVTQSWNGSTWSTPPATLNTARRDLGGSSSGTQTAALAFGGNINPPVVASTELYNGTSWTTTTNMATGRTSLGGTGTQTSALAFGGGPVSTATEEWTGSTLQTKTITTS